MTNGTDALPSAPDAERGLIGCVIVNPDVYGEVRALPATDFIDPLHVKIWRKFQQQHQRGGVDPMLAARELEQAGYFLELGTDHAILPVHAPGQAAKIIEARRKRQWHDLGTRILEGALNGRSSESIRYEVECTVADFAGEANSTKPQERFTLGELCRQYPILNVPIIDGLFRRGETVNIISTSKVGKSWLGYGLGLSIITGRPWLGRFNTTPGKVLLVDNELHRSTLAHRIPAVAVAMGIPPGECEHEFDIWPKRGNLCTLHDLAADFDTIEPGEFQLIILDAKYRLAAAGANENDNASETQFYNLIDECAERTGAAFVLIHHASKGNQADKRVTDVGAGAGAQSRAADCHLILREHEEEGVVVFEAAVRSFAPVEPVALRWDFPLWLPTDSVDTAKLKGRLTRGEQRQNDKDREGLDTTIKALRDGPVTARHLRTKTGFGEYRQERLLNLLTSQGHAKKVGNEYQLSE